MRFPLTYPQPDAGLWELLEEHPGLEADGFTGSENPSLEFDLAGWDEAWREMWEQEDAEHGKDERG